MICASEQNLLYFACILPSIVALYFVIAGNIFAHRLWLNRWLLWFVLNFVGGICSWGLLIPLRTMPPVGISETTPPKPCMWFYDGTGYQWKLETSNDKDYANQILAKGESVDRRVLSINENGKYMTVDAELTAGIM